REGRRGATGRRADDDHRCPSSRYALPALHYSSEHDDRPIDDHDQPAMTVAFDSSLVGSPIRADETRVEAAQWSAETVFITLAPAVHGYLRTQLPSEADDLLSDVFLDVARAVGRFRGDEAALRRWVFT